MATAAYCDACASYVYVTEEGACPNGHTAEHLTAHYEADPPAYPQPAAQPVVQPLPPQTRPPSRRPKWLVPAIIAVLMVFGLSFAAFAVDFMGEFSSATAHSDCFTQQRDIEDAVIDYVTAQGAVPSTMDELVPAYLPERPVCPEEGSYLYDFESFSLTCSVHGYYAPPEDCATDT